MYRIIGSLLAHRPWHSLKMHPSLVRGKARMTKRAAVFVSVARMVPCASAMAAYKNVLFTLFSSRPGLVSCGSPCFCRKSFLNPRRKLFNMSIFLLGICFCARRTVDGQNSDRCRGVWGYGGSEGASRRLRPPKGGGGKRPVGAADAQPRERFRWGGCVWGESHAPQASFFENPPPLRVAKHISAAGLTL